MGNVTDARVNRHHLPDWRWVPRIVNFQILLTCPNVNLLRHVGSPAQLVLHSYVVATKGLEDVDHYELCRTVLVAVRASAAGARCQDFEDSMLVGGVKITASGPSIGKGFANHALKVDAHVTLSAGFYRIGALFAVTFL